MKQRKTRSDKGKKRTRRRLALLGATSGGFILGAGIMSLKRTSPLENRSSSKPAKSSFKNISGTQLVIPGIEVGLNPGSKLKEKNSVSEVVLRELKDAKNNIYPKTKRVRGYSRQGNLFSYASRFKKK